MHWTLRHWRLAVLVLAPLVCLALPFTDLENPRRAWCGFTMLVMAAYWISEAIPLSATALLPVLLLPVTGVLSTAATCSAYMGSANMLFMAGLMVAVAVEHSQLHQRIALRVLLLVGDGLPQLMFGFMATSMFLSMWISNTACTAMMVPIVAQLIDVFLETRSEGCDQHLSEKFTSQETYIQLEENRKPTRPLDEEREKETKITTHREASDFETKDKDRRLLTAAFYIGVAYASNCGGTGTLTGTSPNLVFVGQLEQMFGPETGLTYTSFMAFAVPVMLTCTLFCWLWLNMLFIGPKRFISSFRRDKNQQEHSGIRNALLERHRALGPMNFHQGAVLTLFILLVVLWISRDPKFIPGWQNLFSVAISDASPAILIVMLMFALPADPRQLKIRTKYDPILPWSVVQEKVPWGVLILLGGGFALASGATTSGLSELLSKWMSPALRLQPWLAALVISSCAAAVTELCSNTATASVMLPVLGRVAQKTQTNPLLLMLPTTISTSYAFMLPVATPPNAIVYQSGSLRTSDMARAGIVMNIICLLTVNGFLNTLGVSLFDLYNTPAWINGTLANST